MFRIGNRFTREGEMGPIYTAFSRREAIWSKLIAASCMIGFVRR